MTFVVKSRGGGYAARHVLLSSSTSHSVSIRIGRKFLWDDKNREIFSKVAGKCYLPATRMFTELIKAWPGFKITLGMSGTFLEQAELLRARRDRGPPGAPRVGRGERTGRVSRRNLLPLPDEPLRGPPENGIPRAVLPPPGEDASAFRDLPDLLSETRS